MFERWCSSREVYDFERLQQLILLEEFKSSVHSDIQTYLEEQNVTTLQKAAVLADQYSLTHKIPQKSGSQIQVKKPGLDKIASSNPNASSNKTDGQIKGSSSPPKICFYCKKKGHMISDCLILERKKNKGTPNALVSSKTPIVPLVSTPLVPPEKVVAEEFVPFVSKGVVSIVDTVTLVVLSLF